MNQKDIGWSEKRRLSSRTLAYYFDCYGREWTSIRDAANAVAAELGIDTLKKRRSMIAIECHDRLGSMGFRSPEDYVPPWLRDGRIHIRRPAARRTVRDRYLAFYDSIEWKRLRFAVLKERGRRCECCGADSTSAMIHVDHVKSLKKHWHLRLDHTNLQVLCGDCNRGKGNGEADFRA